MIDKFIPILALIFISANTLFANTYFVSTNGSDTASGNISAPWLTIGKSIGKLASGDTLIVNAGNYSDSNGGSYYTFAGSGFTVNATNAIVNVLATSNGNYGFYNFSGNNVTVNGLKFTTTSAGYEGAVIETSGSGILVENCEIYGFNAQLVSGNTGDLVFLCVNTGNFTTFTNIFIHDIDDADIFRIWGYTNQVVSCNVSNCYNRHYNYSGSSQLHADFEQSFGNSGLPASYITFRNNLCQNCGIQPFTLSTDGDANINHWYFLNNVWNNVAGTGTMGVNAFFYNNVFYNCGTDNDILMTIAGNTANGWDCAGSQFINNVFVTPYYSELSQDSGTSYPISSLLFENNYFGYSPTFVVSTVYGTSYVSGGNPQLLNAAGNGFQIQSNSVLRGAGTNLSGIFTTDAAGNTRPTTGAWDIGAYEYGANNGSNGGGSTNTIPTVSAISANASDIDQTQAGLQIYGGTVVSLSATATNALTYQWSYTVNGGSPVIFQSGSGAVPAVNFSYDTNTIGNTYVWTLSVSNSQGSAQSELSLNVVSPPIASSSLTFAAQNGSITAPFVLGTNGVTIYVYQPIQTIGINSNGIATYNFSITNAGNYEIQALVDAPNDGANSLYVNIDAIPQDPTMIWDVALTSGFEERLVSWRGTTGTDTADEYVPWIFNLTTGPHQIIFYGREANTLLASFSILPAPPTPPPPLIINQ